MSSSPQDDNKLLIRCPKCRQRFKVNPEFQGRMVECGVCENRFHIRDEVIIRIRKFYPGEKHHHGLNRFQRVGYSQPINAPMSAEEVAAPMAPMPLPAAAAYHPVPPQRILAGMIGIGAMVAVALLMIFGSDHGGPLDGMQISRKLLLAGFTSTLGFVLLFYANPNTRRVATLFGIFATCGLMAIPFATRDRTLSIEELGDAAAVVVDDEPEAPPLSPREQQIATMRERANIRPLEQEIERLREENSDKKAYGLLFVGLQESNRIAVRDYMFRVTSAEASSHIYPRNEGEYLFVLTGLEMNLERLASLTSPLGTVGELIPELNLAVIAINNQVFIEPPSSTLIDRAHPDYYALNLRELNSIELQRIERAVTRLAEAEPRMYRVDIARRLRELLGESGVTFYAIIAKALRVWDSDVDAAAAAAKQTALAIHERGSVMPTEVIALALERPAPELVPALVAQWRNNTLMWENYCIRIGNVIEPAMLQQLENPDMSLTHSATRILGHVGGSASIEKLESLKQSANPELVIILNRALERIATRAAAE